MVFAVWTDFLAIFDSRGVGIIQILRLGLAGGALGVGCTRCCFLWDGGSR